MEEYGVSVAFLAFGFATWDPEKNQAQSEAEDYDALKKADDSKKPTVRGRASPNAPLLLHPVEISQSRGAKDDWQIKLVDGFQVNGVLLHVLNNDRERISEESLLEAADSISAASDFGELMVKFADLRSKVASDCEDVEGFETSDEIVIGTFSYQKQSMVNDVSNLDAIARSEIVSALAGDAESAKRVRSVAQDISVSASGPDYSPVDSEYLVLDADASQSFVVNAALSGRNLVVQGPPGTGKSQTIANTIASLIANDKSVLFVAQKRAAITAVLDRLEGAQLSHLLLDLFASDGARRFVSDELRFVFDQHHLDESPDAGQLHAQLSANRDRLVGHKDALTSRRHGWGTSIYELRAETLGFEPEEKIPFRLHPSIFASWDTTTLSQLENAILELERLGALGRGWFSDPGWNPRAITNSNAAKQARADAHTLRWEILPALKDGLSQLARLSGSTFPAGLFESGALSKLHSDASEVAATSAELLTEADLDGMLAGASKSHRRNMERMPFGRLRLAKKSISRLLDGTPPERRIDLLVKAKAVKSAWSRDLPIAPNPGAHNVATQLSIAIEKVRCLEVVSQGIPLTQMDFNQLEGALDSLLSDQNAKLMVRAFDLEFFLNSQGAGPFVHHLRALHSSGRAGDVGADRLLRWVCLRSVLENAEIESPEIAGARGEDLKSATQQFQDSDRRHLAANADRVRAQCAKYLSRAFNNFPDQHSLLKSEITRKRNFKPVRRLFLEARDVLLAAKPVWAMSPLQVSKSLPPTQCFDVVIFDEASQVKPADAIPALMRGNQVIVAGDSRQLPPTEFFAKVLEDEAEGDEVDEITLLNHENSETSPSSGSHTTSHTRDAESILFAMDNLLAGQSRRLQWHYRSQDERLIAVSNRYVYDDSLTTFPSADTRDTIRHVVVPYSPGISGGANSPSLEVERVVELLKEQVAARPQESVGIITFGVKHQARLEQSIGRARDEDLEFDRALATRTDEPWFVKSIERVQGDERDAIILSMGYGKDADGRLKYFWGPLLREGGERRLNVAISRAKKRMTLVTSFSKDDVAPDGHPSQGFKLMYNFVRFMSLGRHETTGSSQRIHPLNPFEVDIKQRLEAAGLILDSQVGVGSYRIDFAARHPELPGRHVLAIEADGASYHSGQTARERDRLRQTLLERRGWRFHRIWSTDWFNDAEAEVNRVIEAFEAAMNDERSLLAHHDSSEEWRE